MSYVFPDISTPIEKEIVKFRDCAEIFKSGVTESGIYSIHLPNSTQKTKVSRFKQLNFHVDNKQVSNHYDGEEKKLHHFVKHETWHVS